MGILKICQTPDNNIPQAQHWLEEVNDQGMEELAGWQSGAYMLAKSYTDVVQAQYWYSKVFDVAYAHRNFALAIQSAVDLGYLFWLRKNLGQASSFIRRVREMVNKLNDPDEKIIELMIRAITIEAQIAYYSSRDQDCENLLGEAIDLAKGTGLNQIADELRPYLNFINLRACKFDPAGRIDQVLGARLLWGVFEIEQRCPVCHKEIEFEDLLENRLWCCPNCNTYVHIDCLSITGNMCPSCRTPYVAIDQ